MYVFKNLTEQLLNKTTLNHPWFQQEITREIFKYLELVENENTTNENLWNEAKAIVRGKFIALNIVLEKKKASNQLSKLST